MDRNLIKQTHSEEYRQIGRLIAYYRKLRGFTQKQLAEYIGISRTHLSNIEAQDIPTSLSLETLFRISDILKIPVRHLLEFQE